MSDRSSTPSSRSIPTPRTDKFRPPVTTIRRASEFTAMWNELLDSHEQLERELHNSRVLFDAVSDSAARSETEEKKFEPDEILRAAHIKAIDESPLISSLLYDIDLLPEQIKDERRYNYMLAVIDHMRQALKNAAPQVGQSGETPAREGVKSPDPDDPAESASRCVAVPLGPYDQIIVQKEFDGYAAMILFRGPDAHEHAKKAVEVLSGERPSEK